MRRSTPSTSLLPCVLIILFISFNYLLIVSTGLGNRAVAVVFNFDLIVFETGKKIGAKNTLKSTPKKKKNKRRNNTTVIANRWRERSLRIHENHLIIIIKHQLILIAQLKSFPTFPSPLSEHRPTNTIPCRFMNLYKVNFPDRKTRKRRREHAKH